MSLRNVRWFRCHFVVVVAFTILVLLLLLLLLHLQYLSFCCCCCCICSTCPFVVVVAFTVLVLLLLLLVVVVVVAFLWSRSPLSSRLTTLLSHVVLNEWLSLIVACLQSLSVDVKQQKSISSALWIPTQVVYLQRCLVVTWLVPRKTAVVSARSVYTIQPCTMSCHSMQNHLRRVHAFLSVTSQLHFWQNDRDVLRAAAVREWGMRQGVGVGGI